MSQGAVFKLVLRDERFDQFFQASDYLKTRLADIRKRRAAAGDRDVNPTFADIEKSHILYVHSIYKPYVSIASEYTRVKASGDGTAAIGPSGGTLTFTFPIVGHFTSDMALHIRTKPIGNQALYNDVTVGGNPTLANPLLRYCAYPGLRVAQSVQFRSDAVTIDEYTPEDAVAYMQFFVEKDTKSGWDRCHGQQELRTATTVANGSMNQITYSDGLQTPKLYHEGVDLFIPLQFWFCRDVSSALLNDLIPNTQREILVNLAPLSQIVQAMLPASTNPLDPGFPNQTTPPIVGFTQVALPFDKLAIEADLYVNNLYVSPEIHDIFASRVGFSLIRVHRRQISQLQSDSGSFLLDQLKFPAEYFMCGMRARANLQDFDRWWLMGTKKARIDTNRLLIPTLIWNTAIGVAQLVAREAVESSTLESFTDTIGVTAHGIDLFPQFPATFYNAYMPIRYHANTMNIAPEDTSAFLVNFCLYPGSSTPSGYYNLSAGRELYINYTLKSSSPFVQTLQPGQAELVTVMSALNFLIRRGDKVSLKYAL